MERPQHPKDGCYPGSAHQSQEGNDQSISHISEGVIKMECQLCFCDGFGEDELIDTGHGDVCEMCYGELKERNRSRGIKPTPAFDSNRAEKKEKPAKKKTTKKKKATKKKTTKKG